MKAATLSDIKKELIEKQPNDLVEICLRLIKFKKENKELLTYILFDSKNEDDYLKELKNEIEFDFSKINSANLYWAKKSLRKILRTINKHIRYSNQSVNTVELLIFYCTKLKTSNIEFEKSTALKNLYYSQLKKIKKEISSMHEDLQYDYKKKLLLLEN